MMFKLETIFTLTVFVVPLFTSTPFLKRPQDLGWHTYKSSGQQRGRFGCLPQLVPERLREDQETRGLLMQLWPQIR